MSLRVVYQLFSLRFVQIRVNPWSKIIRVDPCEMTSIVPKI